jgi:heme exporter protein B
MASEASSAGSPQAASAPRPAATHVNTHSASLYRQALLILQKDLRLELRNRAAINAIMLFSVTALMIISFAGGVKDLPITAKGGLMWVLLFFAAFSGLAHVFLQEEESQTALGLRLSAAPNAVFVGKLLFNLLLMGLLVVVLAPLSVIVLKIPVERPLMFTISLLAGSLGLAIAATIVAAIIAQARGKGALYGALGFPILLPQLMLAVAATKQAIDPNAGGDGWTFTGGLISFAVMLTVAAFWVFPTVWEE